MHLPLIPLLPFTVAFIAGILLQGCGMSGFFIILPLAFAVIAACRSRNYSAILSLGIVIGYGISYLNTAVPLPDSLRDRNVQYSALVTEVRHYEPTQTAIVRIDSCSGKAVRPFLAKISIPSSLPVIDERWRINFSAALSPVSRKPDLPDEIDYDATLRRLGVVGQALVSPDSLTPLAPEPGLLNAIRRQREAVTRMIARSPLSDPTQAFLNAALTGDRSMLSPDSRDIFAATGISHILALSGLHVGILTLILLIMLLPLRLCRMNALRTLLLILLLWAFAILTGLTPSVVRAVIMATIFMLALLFQRVRSPFNSLCLAALLILLFSPMAVYTIGFQLSFFAVGAILIFAEKLNPVSQRHSFARSIAAYPAVTLSAILGTGIVSAFYFHIFPVYFFPLNFLCALLLPFIIGGGVILLCANTLGLHWLWLAKTIDFLYSLILSTADTISTLPGAVAEDILISPVTIVTWLLALTFLALWLYKKRPAYGLASLMLCIFSAVSLSGGYGLEPGGAEVYIPRTGRQTSLLIRHDSSLYLATTAHTHEIHDIIENFGRKYSLFMIKRDIDSIQLLPQYCHSSVFSRADNLFTFKTSAPYGTGIGSPSTTTLLLVSSTSQILDYGRKINYAIVCNGFRGDILDLALTTAPDTIILSADLNRRRHDRYARELAADSIPFRSLRHSGFSLTLQ